MADNNDANVFIETFKRIFKAQYCLGEYKPADGVSYMDAVTETAKQSFVGRMSKDEYLHYIVPAIILSIIPLVGLAFILPNCSTTGRRLHDIGQSAWLCLLMIIPLVNLALLIYLCVTDGKAESNQYGEPPAA